MQPLDLPDASAIQSLYTDSPFPSILALLPTLSTSASRNVGIVSALRTIEAHEYVWELRYRISDAAKSFCLAAHYFAMGIPDKRWHISPGRNGASIEYFPDFDELHYGIKDWFDFFADTYCYKLFSALDLLAHVINSLFVLGLKKRGVKFTAAVTRLETSEARLHSDLSELTRSHVFQEARKIRNNITHNYLPHSAGLSVSISEKGASLGLRPYTDSATMMNNMRDVAKLLQEAIVATSRALTPPAT